LTDIDTSGKLVDRTYIDNRLYLEVLMAGRVQLALNVDDLGESIAFYSKLFGAEPAKVRPGYANFAIAEPPLKLVLLENPGHGGSLNHLGVEVDGTGAVEAEQARLAGAGLAAVEERDTTCCYARQDKFWVKGAPDGERWEIYTVTGDSPTFWGEDGGGSWDAAAAELDAAPGDPAAARQAGSGPQCCGSGPRDEQADAAAHA
jgi:catechol 2,3-dioxygenase-like lactoylglutathione lyase family enzyme